MAEQQPVILSKDELTLLSFLHEWGKKGRVSPKYETVLLFLEDVIGSKRRLLAAIRGLQKAGVLIVANDRSFEASSLEGFNLQRSSALTYLDVESVAIETPQIPTRIESGSSGWRSVDLPKKERVRAPRRMSTSAEVLDILSTSIYLPWRKDVYITKQAIVTSSNSCVSW